MLPLRRHRNQQWTKIRRFPACMHRLGLASLVTAGAVAPPVAQAPRQSRVVSPSVRPRSTTPALPTAEALLARSGDAYVWEAKTATGVRWRFGTALVEKQILLDGGYLALTSFTDRTTRHEYVQGPSDLLEFTWNGEPVTGHSTTWHLDGVTTQRLAQGELLLQLTLHTVSGPQVGIIKSYLLYPKESIVQEWLRITNRSGQPATLVDPAALTMNVLQHETPAIDFTAWHRGPATEPLAKPEVRVVNGYATIDYGPIQIFQNRETKHGFFMGWDYIGLWRSTIGMVDGRPGHVDFRVAHYRRTLAPAETVETPKAFTGMFHGDFDDMGHQLLDYQYRYKWDYTRSPYFPSTALEGDWHFGGHLPWGDGMDPIANYRKVFRGVDIMRTIGADAFWRDIGWWDKQGEWNGPDWGEAGRYLAQYGMTQTIYLPVQTSAPDSRLAREHPEWITSEKVGVDNEGLFSDQSQAAVRAWELQLLNAKRQQWGDFEWRKDWVATVFMRDSAGGLDSSRLLAQDQGFRHLVQEFLSQNPGAAFHGCAGGATDLSYEMLRLGSNWQLGEGGASGDHYWASYLFPPDKLENVPDDYYLTHYDKSWRALMWGRVALWNALADPAKLEDIRLMYDIDHYLVHEGVFGRWGFVYHPAVTGDSAEQYLERLSRDGQRGVIITGHSPKSPATIYPKGLLPGVTYHVSYQESLETQRRLGTDLMAHGISLKTIPEGEIIYLNLPKHPGSIADRTPPTPPSGVTQEFATHMDVSGVELRWQPGHDDNWVSYYQIYRNGIPIDKVAKGTYYFDHALGADLATRYAVATVDGSGNHSKPVAALTVAPAATLVVDDTSAAVTYHGRGWQHDTAQWAANGTQARTRTPGDSVTYTFTGSGVTWYSRMGHDKGVAAVYLDGRLDRLVDTYGADEIPNIAVYSRMFPAIERHTITIVATGRHSTPTPEPQPDWTPHPGAQDAAWIVVDGFQVDQTQPKIARASSRSGIVYHGTGWHHEASHQPSMGNQEAPSLQDGAWSDRAGDTATYAFMGTGITWVGRRCSHCGTADVYVDGELVTSVDQFAQQAVVDSTLSADQQYAVPVFMRRWTRPGRHTLRIVVRSYANVWATGHDVYLDALYVVP